SRSIGYVGPATSLQLREQRYAVYSEYVKRRGLRGCDIALLPAESLCEAGRQSIHRLLDDGHSIPDALFCQNDEIALGVYRGLHERGIEVPRRVRLVGWDDLPYR